MPLEPKLEERKKYLLVKVEDRTITDAEALELADILNNDAKIRELDDGVRTLIILGLGALGGHVIIADLVTRWKIRAGVKMKRCCGICGKKIYSSHLLCESCYEERRPMYPRCGGIERCKCWPEDGPCQPEPHR